MEEFFQGFPAQLKLQGEFVEDAAEDKLVAQVFLGGLREGPSIVGTSLQYDSIMSGSSDPALIKQHIQEAIDMVGGKGLMIGPGCVADPRSPAENLHAVRAAVER